MSYTLDTVFKIGDKEVKKLQNFLGYELYQCEMDISHDDKIWTYFVKDGLVYAIVNASSEGGMECSSSVSIDFIEKKQG